MASFGKIWCIVGEFILVILEHIGKQITRGLVKFFVIALTLFCLIWCRAYAGHSFAQRLGKLIERLVCEGVIDWKIRVYILV